MAYSGVGGSSKSGRGKRKIVKKCRKVILTDSRERTKLASHGKGGRSKRCRNTLGVVSYVR
jgi:hypothetical protein